MLYNVMVVHVNVHIISTLASLYGELGKYQESEEMFKKAMKINPTYAEAYFNLGKINTIHPPNRAILCIATVLQGLYMSRWVDWTMEKETYYMH